MAQSRRQTSNASEGHELRRRHLGPAPLEEKVPQADFRLKLMGGFDLTHHGASLDVALGAQRVLALLALADHPTSRSWIAGTLWPELTDARSRANLRNALWRFEHSGEVLLSTREHLCLRDSVAVDVRDLTVRVQQFAEHPDTIFPESELQQLTSALLPGWDDEWVVLVRERTLQRNLHLLDRLVKGYLDQQEPAAAIDLALRLVSLDPFREPTHAVLLQAYVASGDRAAALRHFDSFARTLGKEMGLRPSARLRNLVEEIREPDLLRPWRPAGQEPAQLGPGRTNNLRAQRPTSPGQH